MFSGTVRAGEGRSVATVPFWAVDLTERFWREDTPVVETVYLRASSDPIFLQMAYTGMTTLTAIRKEGRHLGREWVMMRWKRAATKRQCLCA